VADATGEHASDRMIEERFTALAAPTAQPRLVTP
jgi:hypothetical protein